MNKIILTAALELCTSSEARALFISYLSYNINYILCILTDLSGLLIEALTSIFVILGQPDVKFYVNELKKLSFHLSEFSVVLKHL